MCKFIEGRVWTLLWVIWEICWVIASAAQGATSPLTDDIPFRITWPGSEFTMPKTGVLYREEDYVLMTTTDKETYKCMLPSLASGDEGDDKNYSGPNPAALLEPLFKESSCSYRIESYWTYEVCHGKHVRQYHEEKETGQKINIQEYYLGSMIKKSEPATAVVESEKMEETEQKESEKEIPTKNVEGQMTPYYPLEMGNGTPCTLKQHHPRSSTVMYVCHPDAKHEILSIAEITTCEYEVMVLTPLLCSHPKYRFKSSPVNDIFCQSLQGSPMRPQRLTQQDREQQDLMKPAFISRDKEEETSSVREERFSSTHKPISVGGQQQVTVGTTHISKLTDEQLVKEFLSGSYCLHGGVGWWKYEFCYGKYVHQYHENKESGKSILVVGNWNQEDHLGWAKKNVARSYQLKDDDVQKVKVVSHFYGHGDVCDLTGKPREVIVKLKCRESESPHAVTIYMLEPQACQYILGVESPVICKILDTADENGMLSVPI